jgi:hypothetical protein
MDEPHYQAFRGMQEDKLSPLAIGNSKTVHAPRFDPVSKVNDERIVNPQRQCRQRISIEAGMQIGLNREH